MSVYSLSNIMLKVMLSVFVCVCGGGGFVFIRFCLSAKRECEFDVVVL